jgi:hypothetical protein
MCAHPLSAMFREVHREGRGQRSKAQANVHGSLLSASWPGLDRGPVLTHGQHETALSGHCGESRISIFRVGVRATKTPL